MSIDISIEDAKKLGLKGALEVGEDIGFTDFSKTRAPALQNAFLDLENLGALNQDNPRLVIRNLIFSDTDNVNYAYNTYKTWRQAVESEHFYTKYTIYTKLIGQLGDIDFAEDYCKYQNNNFFRPFDFSKIYPVQEINNFPYCRFRFPKDISNTSEVQINTNSGSASIRPKFVGVLSKEESRKTYYRWHPQHTRFASGQQQSNYDNLNLSGFNIPYPNTISIFDSVSYNIPVKIAPKFNQDNNQTLKGLLIISTGTAEFKKICYVSPHGIETGYSNTIEDIYNEEFRFTRQKSFNTATQASIIGSSWYDTSLGSGYIGGGETGWINNLNGTYNQFSIGSAGGKHQRYYNVSDPKKQIYFDNRISCQYGSGVWCICISGAPVNTGQKAVIYMHAPSNLNDWKKTDPRTLTGPWVTASGHPFALSGAFSKANKSMPAVSHYKVYRKQKSVTPYRLQVPTLFIDSKYINSGHVLPEGACYINKAFTGTPIAPAWRIIPTLPIASGSGLHFSGYIIDNQYVSQAQIISSGIAVQTGIKYDNILFMSSSGCFAQQTPLKDTYFYKFYNSLYDSDIYGKSIASGTWNGIIPSGVHFSIELVSTSLNANAGINGSSLGIFYSGYGNGNIIDSALISGISSLGSATLFPSPSTGSIDWVQNRFPSKFHINLQGMLEYTAYASGPTTEDAKNISRTKCLKSINSKIRQLTNQILPNAINKNRKWIKMQSFKQKSAYSQFSDIDIAESSTPGSPIQKRLIKYASGII